MDLDLFLDISSEYCLSFLLVYIKNYTDLSGVGDRKDVPSYHLSIETPTPLSLGVGVYGTSGMLCLLCI